MTPIAIDVVADIMPNRYIGTVEFDTEVTPDQFIHAVIAAERAIAERVPYMCRTGRCRAANNAIRLYFHASSWGESKAFSTRATAAS